MAKKPDPFARPKKPSRPAPRMVPDAISSRRSVPHPTVAKIVASLARHPKPTPHKAAARPPAYPASQPSYTQHRAAAVKTQKRPAGNKLHKNKPPKTPHKTQAHKTGVKSGGLILPMDPYLKPQKPKARAQAWGDIANLLGPPDPAYAARSPDDLALSASDYSQVFANPFIDLAMQLMGSGGGGGGGGGGATSNASLYSSAPTVAAPAGAAAPSTGANTRSLFNNMISDQGAQQQADMSKFLDSIGAPQNLRDQLSAANAQQTSSATALHNAQEDVIQSAQTLSAQNRVAGQQYAAAALSGHVSGGGSSSDPFAKALAKIISDGPNNAYKSFAQLVGLEKTNAGLRFDERKQLSNLGSTFYQKAEDRDLKAAMARQNTTRDYMRLVASSQQAAGRLKASLRGQNISARGQAGRLAESQRSHDQSAAARAASLAEQQRHHSASEAQAAANAAIRAAAKHSGLSPSSVNTVYRGAVSQAKTLYKGTSTTADPFHASTTGKPVPRPRAYRQVRTYISAQIPSLGAKQLNALTEKALIAGGYKKVAPKKTKTVGAHPRRT